MKMPPITASSTNLRFGRVTVNMGKGTMKSAHNYPDPKVKNGKTMQNEQ
jgi:hypothetical protein